MRTHVTTALVGLLVLSAGTSPAPAAAQVSYGVHVVEARDAFEGARGIGARVGVKVPFLPVSAFATGEYFRPDCGPASGCGLSGVSLDLNYALIPMLPVSPYLTGGYTRRRFDPGAGGEVSTPEGIHVGAGLAAGLAGYGVFGEARYEFVAAPERQIVVRVGVRRGF